MPDNPDRLVARDDDSPPRMKRGNDERPERVPTPGHEGAVRVPEAEWERHERRRDAAQGLADEEPPTE